MSTMRWAVGITTVPSRMKDLLPQTLGSLLDGGFAVSRLFVDGCGHGKASLLHEKFGLPMTLRDPGIGVWGNWILGLGELYVREPLCKRYAMFQDDLVMCKGVKSLLDSTPFPVNGYWNLYTEPRNQAKCLGPSGWYRSDQKGRGAVALVFDREGVQRLLTGLRMLHHPTYAGQQHKGVDLSVSETLCRQEGWTEWVHDPSLIQHVGDVSTLGNHCKPSTSFPGKDFDAAPHPSSSAKLGGEREKGGKTLE